MVLPFFVPGRRTVRDARTGLRCALLLHGCGWQPALLSVKGPTVDPELALEPGAGALGVPGALSEDPVDAGPLPETVPA
jgi:hypothetical protein